MNTDAYKNARTHDRRERRRRQAVRGFLLDSLRELDGVGYVRADAPETPEDAPGTPNSPDWDESTPRLNCGACGRLDALKDDMCRYCHADFEAQS